MAFVIKKKVLCALHTFSKQEVSKSFVFVKDIIFSKERFERTDFTFHDDSNAVLSPHRPVHLADHHEHVWTVWCGVL